MADNDSSIVKPVENLQNIPILIPAERYEHRSNRRHPNEGKRKDSEQEKKDIDDKQNLEGEIVENERPDSGSIDYCA